MFSDFGVPVLCAGDVGVPVDLNTLSVGVHGVLACMSLSRCCLGPVIGVLTARNNLSLGVEGVLGVFGVLERSSYLQLVGVPSISVIMFY